MQSWWYLDLKNHSIHSRYGLGSIGRVGSVMLTLCVTVENYITVCKPFDKVRFQKFFAPCGILFAICYNIPKFFEFEVIYIQDNESSMATANNGTEEPLDDVTNSTIGNSTVDIVGRPIWSPTSLKNNYWYAKIYFFAIRFLFIEIIPYCIMSKFRVCFASSFFFETFFFLLSWTQLEDLEPHPRNHKWSQWIWQR